MTGDLTLLEPQEMVAFAGGDLGDGGESFAGMLGRVLGAALGGAWCVLTHPPEASYSYGKVGY